MTAVVRSLAFRILALSFILLALPLFVDSFILIREKYRTLFTEAKIYLIEVNKEKEAPLSELLQTHKSVIPLIIHYLDLEDHFPEKASDELNNKLNEIAKRGDFTGIYIVKFNEKGSFTLMGSTSETVSKNSDALFSAYRYFSGLEFQKDFFSTIYYNVDNARYELIISYLIYSKTKTPIGFLSFSIDLTKQLKEILAIDLIPYPVSFALLLSNRTIIAASDFSLLLYDVTPFTEKDAKNQETKGLEPDIKFGYEYGPPFVSFTWHGQEKIGTVLPITDTSFYLLAYASKSDIFAVPFKDMIRIYWIYALILLIGGTITGLLAWRFAKPLNQLTAVMEGIQKGELGLRFKSDPLGFEINELGFTFNRMIDTLLEKKQKAEQERIKREIYAQELRIGREVQRGLLPEKMPNYQGVEIAEKYLPAKEVGGDFYDLFTREVQDKKELVLMIADASGKGVQACFYSLGVRSSARVFAKEYDDPKVIMQNTNDLFCEDSGDSGMFVTAVMGIYDGRTKIFRYFSCGHNPLFVRKKNGEILKLENLGIAMGFIKEMPGMSSNIQLESGDVVVFYTDGITESLDEENNLFSEERLIHFLKNSHDESAGQIANTLLEEIKIFCGSAPQHDDITLLIMRVL